MSLNGNLKYVFGTYVLEGYSVTHILSDDLLLGLIEGELGYPTPQPELNETSIFKSFQLP